MKRLIQFRMFGYKTFIALLLLVCALCAMAIYGVREAAALYLWTHFEAPVLAAKLDPKNAMLQEKAGSYYFSSENYDIEKAEDYFKRAIALDEQVPRAHFQLGRIYFIKGNFYWALQEVNKELAQYPDFITSYYLRGLVYGFAGESDSSIADFKEFLARKPNSWAGHNDLSWAYFTKGDYIAARDIAAAGLVYAPGNPWLLNSYGVASLNLGDLEEAKRAFEEATIGFAGMEGEDWGRAYPGNDPVLHEAGLAQTRESVAFNLGLIAERTASTP